MAPMEGKSSQKMGEGGTDVGSHESCSLMPLIVLGIMMVLLELQCFPKIHRKLEQWKSDARAYQTICQIY